MTGNARAKEPSETVTASAGGAEGGLHGRESAPPARKVSAAAHEARCEIDRVPERNRSISIRQSGRHLPGQVFWDWLSGVPLGRRRAWVSRTPLLHVCDSVGGLLFAVVLGYAALRLGGWWLLLLAVSLPLTVGRARKCHMTIVHQAVHDQLFQIKNRHLRKWANRLLAETIGVFLWIPDFQTYKKAHVVSHHNPEETATPKDLDGKIVFTMRFGGPGGGAATHPPDVDDTATPGDVDGREVFTLGFVPGMPRDYYRTLLWRITTSPKFYLTDFRQRIYFSLFEAAWYRRAAAALLLLSLVTLSWLRAGWDELVILYLLPVFPLFKLCGLLQQLSEHMWGTHMDLVGSRDRLPLVCQGRFLFDPFPGAELRGGARLRALIRWWLRVPYHLLVRVCVLGGDLPAHHHHHFHPRGTEWVSATHACAARTQADQQYQYTHAWSLGEALDRVFTAMSCAPPLGRKWLDELKQRS